MKNSYDINQEPIVISKITSDIFLKQEHPADLMALYWFYYYTAKWQGTDKARATTSYAAKGLKWSEDRIRRTKKILIQLGLIEDIQNKKGKFEKCYIYVKFIWWDKRKYNDFNDDSRPQGFREGGELGSPQNPEGNALNTLNGNALNTLNGNALNILFLKKWNEQKIIIHKKITSKKLSSIKKALKDFTQEEIFKSFQNYATILHSPDYFWNYTWTMEDFLQRGLHRFVDEAKPLTNLKNNFPVDSKNQTPSQPSKLSPAGFPVIDRTYDRTANKKKTVDEWQKQLERYANQLLDANIWKENYSPDKITVFNGVISMQKWLDNIDYDCLSSAAGGSLEFRIYPLDKLIDYYILCIGEWWSWMDGVKDNVFDVNNKIFKMFIYELEISFAVRIDIKSKGWINDSD